MNPVLSVIIPTYRDSHCLALTLESLRQQQLPSAQFEVIVVADGEPVNADVLKSIEVSGYVYVELDGHLGRAGARNRGIKAAGGEVLVFLDSDSYAAPDLLERHARFQKAGSGSRVLIGTRWEIGWQTLDTILAGAAPDPATMPVEEGDLRFPTWLSDADIDELMRTPWLFTYTNNISVRRDLVLSLGMFDEEFGIRWGFEDLDLFYRADNALGRPAGGFVYDRQARCYHLPHYRSRLGMHDDYMVNMARAKSKFATYEWEFTGLMEPRSASARILHHRDSFEHSRDLPACRATHAWQRCHDLLGIEATSRLLVIGLGTDELDLAKDAWTLDLGRAASERSLPMLGYATGFEFQQFDRVVNVNVWRWFGVLDLSRYIEETLRIAGSSVLVYSTDFAMPPGLDAVSDMDYILQMVAPHLEADVYRRGPDTVITLRRVEAG